jgi:RNA recognition motif-containing protein
VTCQRDFVFLPFPSTHSSLPIYSISAQIIKRRSRHGSRSAGYGFVALTTIEAAQEAVEALNNTELDGRPVIVEIAKPAEEKSKESRPPRKPRKRPTGRRPRSAHGEVTDAEANGEITDKAEAAPGTAPATEGAEKLEKPKKKKKKTHVSILVAATSQLSSPHY